MNVVCLKRSFDVPAEVANEIADLRAQCKELRRELRPGLMRRRLGVNFSFSRFRVRRYNDGQQTWGCL